MSLPFSVADEGVAIHHEKMIADGVNPTFAERKAIAETRGSQFFSFVADELGKALRPLGIRTAAEFENIFSIVAGLKPDDGTVARLEGPIREAMIRGRDRYRASLGLGAAEKISKPGAIRSFISGLNRKFRKAEADPAPEFVRLANIPAEYEYVNQCRCRKCGGFYKPVRQGSAHQDDCVDPPDGRQPSPYMHDFWILTCERCAARRRVTDRKSVV